MQKTYCDLCGDEIKPQPSPFTSPKPWYNLTRVFITPPGLADKHEDLELCATDAGAIRGFINKIRNANATTD